MRSIQRFARKMLPAAFIACSLALVDAGPSPTVGITPVVNTTVSADRIARLAGVGLRIDDPQLSSKLAALAIARHKRPSVVPVKIPSLSSLHVTTSVFPLAGAAASIAAQKTNDPKAAPVITGVSIVHGMNLTLKGSNLADGQKYGTPALSLGNCDVPQPMPLFGGQPPPAQNSKGPVTFFAPIVVPTAEGGTLTISLDGLTSNQSFFTYNPIIATSSNDGELSVGVAVDDVAPYYVLPDVLNQTTSSFATSTDHLSKTFSGPNVTGTDTLGIGTSLLNGWKVTASITNVHSYLDAPGNDGSNDVFRSATVSQQPAIGRLETKVSWKMQPGESMSYEMTWLFTNGVVGARMATTLAKSSSCPIDEQ
jgi:hypothetical protein